MDSAIYLALETIEKNKQAIVFAPSRASAEKTAEDIAKTIKSAMPELEAGVLKGISTPTTQCNRLAKCMKKGIAFHHAGLTNSQKEFIEDSFKEGKVKIICATPTLAAGLSLPVFRVIIKSLKRYSDRWGMDWIQVLEYLQMAGRAGRPEYEKYGEAVAIAKNDSEKKEIYQRYVCGTPEDIYSKLAVEPVLRTYLLSLISSNIIRDEKTMKEFFGKTFWAQQFKDMNKLESIMDRMLSLLEEWKFIVINDKKEDAGDFVSASNIGSNDKTMKATLLGKRVSELYLDPLTARHLLDCTARWHEKTTTFSLLQIISNTIEMRPLLRVKGSEQEMISGELLQRYEMLLMEEPSAFDFEYEDFINSIKTSLFLDSWIDEKREDFLLEKYGIRPGEIRVKLETADWLLYGTEELARVEGYKEVIKEIHKLRLRLKHGVKEELLPLLKIKGIGRIRARKLYNNGMKDIGDLSKTDLTTLRQILGTAVAEGVKKQLGEEIKEIPSGRRTGQLSLTKF